MAGTFRRRLGPSSSYCSRRRERQMSQDQTRATLVSLFLPRLFHPRSCHGGTKALGKTYPYRVVRLVECRRGLGLGSWPAMSKTLVFAGKPVLGLVFGWNCGAPGPRVNFHMPPGKRHGGSIDFPTWAHWNPNDHEARPKATAFRALLPSLFHAVESRQETYNRESESIDHFPLSFVEGIRRARTIPCFDQLPMDACT